MAFVGRTLADPLPQQVNLERIQSGPVGRQGRHPLELVRRADAADQFAGARVTRNDRDAAGERSPSGRLSPIKPQPRLAQGGIRPMTRKAVLGQHRPHVTGEVDRLSRDGPDHRASGERGQAERNPFETIQLHGPMPPDPCP